MRTRVILVLQILSLAFIWVFVLSIDFWILSLLAVSRRLDDAINASVAIGMVAVPLFLTIAILLTYVFIGLQRHSRAGPRLVGGRAAGEEP